jgi:phosphoribosyl-ATP pyrophosphohydrolase
MDNCKLKDMFDKQCVLFDRFRSIEKTHININDINSKEFRQYFDYMFHKMIEEYFEAIMVFKFKKHNDDSDIFDREQFLEEMIDGWHFFMNLMILLNITYDEFYEKYLEKNYKNHKRINKLEEENK